MSMKATELGIVEGYGPSSCLKWGVGTLTQIQREERLRLEAFRRDQAVAKLAALEEPEPESVCPAEPDVCPEDSSVCPEDSSVCLADPWTPDLARTAIRLHSLSEMSQAAFAELHGFPVSRFRSKVCRQVRQESARAVRQGVTL